MTLTTARLVRALTQVLPSLAEGIPKVHGARKAAIFVAGGQTQLRASLPYGVRNGLCDGVVHKLSGSAISRTDGKNKRRQKTSRQR